MKEGNSLGRPSEKVDPEYWSSLRRLSTGTVPWNRLSDGWLSGGGRKEEEQQQREGSRSRETMKAKANTRTSLQTFLSWASSSLKDILRSCTSFSEHKQQYGLLATRLATPEDASPGTWPGLMGMMPRRN